jgi:hypothetical protein
MLTDTCRLQEPQRPHFLYRRYRHHGNRNILHLLADFTVSPNGAGMITTMLESLPDPIGVGLISRAGAYSSAERMCASSMLGTAVETSADQTIRLLLDDYHDHVSRLRDPTMTNPLPAVRFLTEAEVVLLMERFQMLGVEFMERLEPVETEIISKDMHSNFMEQSKTGWLVESSHSPYQLDSGDKGAWAAHIWNYKKQQLATSTDDTRWGVSVVSEVLPIEATLQSDHLPFSEILVLSVQQATAKNNPKLFESKTLQAIIQFKWDSYGRLIHNTSACTPVICGERVHELTRTRACECVCLCVYMCVCVRVCARVFWQLSGVWIFCTHCAFHNRCPGLQVVPQKTRSLVTHDCVVRLGSMCFFNAGTPKTGTV